MDSLLSINPPKTFNARDFSSWLNLIRCFERFRIAAGLDTKSEEYQVNSLNTLAQMTRDKKKYDKVRESFSEHFICNNKIY